jgi:hypothetical protein
MSWVIFTGAQALGQVVLALHLRELRPGVYIFCQNEEACNGNQMIELLNTSLHDCGFTFNGSARGVSLGVTGAIGRHIGKFDIVELYGPKEECVMNILRRSFIWKMGAGASAALARLGHGPGQGTGGTRRTTRLRAALLEEEKALASFIRPSSRRWTRACMKKSSACLLPY